MNNAQIICLVLSHLSAFAIGSFLSSLKDDAEELVMVYFLCGLVFGLLVFGAFVFGAFYG